ncbi:MULTISPECIES: response regulator transcription factor [unclassified Corallococcus]|uniref:response regulator transcription factor n=1 Tax=unclassified Corallococcus TaxID=2685029 RepID=UPI001A9002C4|nr:MULTISPECIES: LuxR C-terminal-related transcriptional regulator [unclassified Corallococcus]MBN9682405.1 response regulator transcription factor [Corallococcus sp. NCSPR001]WAS86041.1 LuxR C-terminal-related transcriptional regulator [Corallococcus sp. NCRR]
MRTPLPPGSHVLLVVPDPNAPAAPQEQNRALAGELILNGQRYHLVPAEDSANPPTTTPAAEARLLTSRELQVVSCVCAGWGNKEIATKLHISTWTVAAHLRRIFVKLGVDTRAAMVSRCLGAVSLPRTP